MLLFIFDRWERSVGFVSRSCMLIICTKWKMPVNIRLIVILFLLLVVSLILSRTHQHAIKRICLQHQHPEWWCPPQTIIDWARSTNGSNDCLGYQLIVVFVVASTTTSAIVGCTTLVVARLLLCRTWWWQICWSVDLLSSGDQWRLGRSMGGKAREGVVMARAVLLCLVRMRGDDGVDITVLRGDDLPRDYSLKRLLHLCWLLVGQVIKHERWGSDEGTSSGSGPSSSGPFLLLCLWRPTPFILGMAREEEGWGMQQ